MNEEQRLVQKRLRVLEHAWKQEQGSLSIGPIAAITVLTNVQFIFGIKLDIGQFPPGLISS